LGKKKGLREKLRRPESRAAKKPIYAKIDAGKTVVEHGRGGDGKPGEGMPGEMGRTDALI